MRKIITLILLTVLLGSGCRGRSSEPVTETGYYLGTIVRITIYDEKIPEGIFTEIFNLIIDYENRLSRNIEESEISEINRNAGLKPVEISDTTFTLLEKGLNYSSVPGSSFDITIGPLVSLWGIGTEDAKLPEYPEIKKAMEKVDYKKLILDKNRSTAYLTEKGMEVDCGAIAKGYIADRAADLLKAKKITSAIINLGGNVLVIGGKPDNKFFRIGIQDPDDTRGEYIGIAEIEGKSLVTSGIYERYFEKDGIRYHHILDPETGYPVKSSILGITVLTDNSVDGDALSTTLFTMGIEKGLELAEKTENTEVLFVSDKGKLYMTKGFSDIFTLKSSRYTLEEE